MIIISPLSKGAGGDIVKVQVEYMHISVGVKVG